MSGLQRVISKVRVIYYIFNQIKVGWTSKSYSQRGDWMGRIFGPERVINTHNERITTVCRNY